MRWLLILIAPLIWPVWRRARRLEPADTLSVRSILLTEEGLRLLLRFGAEEPLIEEDEREMIDGIVRLGDKTVAEVMVPRVDVVALPVDATLEEALDVCVTSGHSRIPVYEDTIDRIVGVLYAKDLLTHFRARFLEGKSGFALRELMRKPYFVPESALVGDLLSELQHKKTHLAIVVDEYGGTAGIVTIEDLLEEIVGEIQDEYDFEAPLIQQVEPQVYLISGRANIDDVNRELGLSLTDEDESYTLAGVIYSHLQRVPDVGDKVELDDAQLEVVSVNDNRIAQVRVVLKQPSGETTAGNTVA
ncbi:MAG: hemolysin family protein [Caldilineales bacterium]|nr:hemolysin family protein [Caldilineales bacterium]